MLKDLPLLSGDASQSSVLSRPLLLRLAVVSIDAKGLFDVEMLLLTEAMLYTL